MKKCIVSLISCVFLFLVTLTSFAEEKPLRPSGLDTPKPQDQKIYIKGDTLKTIISAENDKSQPRDSLMQRYKVLYETKDGQKDTFTLQVQMNKEGKIIKADIVNLTKTAGGWNTTVK